MGQTLHAKRDEQTQTDNRKDYHPEKKRSGLSFPFVSRPGTNLVAQVGSAQHSLLEIQEGMCWVIHLYETLTGTRHRKAK